MIIFFVLFQTILISFVCSSNDYNFQKENILNSTKTCIVSKNSYRSEIKFDNSSFFIIKNYNFVYDLIFKKKKIACAEYGLEEGWNILNIKTYKDFSNEIQSYFAGYIEGYIYHELIDFHYKNIFETILNGKNIPENLQLYIKSQKKFLKKLANSTDIGNGKKL